jgi:hypothetical protein
MAGSISDLRARYWDLRSTKGTFMILYDSFSI